ncbi:Bone marrow stromal antigen 2 [Cricetulus griseus]|uniref:Bone marrow stromal antigen 2 n=1 Tax=Cricetulus griseus TaxID=10029 RepID=G3H4E0_CRIGR|nr:Bone marrow stromal antigen 2 [Cricetulus griseus]
MAPTFYHYHPLPMDQKEPGCGIRWRCLAAASVLILVALVIPLIIFAVKANSEACRDGLRAQEECSNTTRLLQRQLTRSQDNLAQAEAQASTCNRTVVTLQDSLEKKVSQIQEKQALIQEQEAQIKEQEAQIKEQEAQIKEQKAHIQEQQVRIQKLEAPSVSVSSSTLPPPTPRCLQSRLQTQLKTLKIEMDEAKAQGTQMGLENGELTGGLG